MKWIFGFLSILTLSLIAYSLPAAADNDDYYNYNNYHQYNSGNYNNDNQYGYDEGYQHGLADRRAGLNFDLQHDRDYQMGSANFQNSYAQGYSNAYFARRNYNSTPNYSPYGYGYNGPYSNMYGRSNSNYGYSEVTVYKKDGMRGSSHT